MSDRDRILRDHGINPPQQGGQTPPSEKKKPTSLYDAKPKKTGLDRYHQSVENRIGKRMRKRWESLASRFRRQS